MKRIKAGSANRYGDVIDTRVTKILEKAMPTQHNAQEFAQMRLTAQADYIVAEVLAGYFKVRTRGTRFPIKNGQWVFLYEGDRINIPPDGTYEVQPQNI
ncbi:hypothetical protein J4234_02735 [Candidatus Woesearchaeota archaeon]|nr:hypothetical protein [Candidatus Woesearchaeota archaeon]